MRRLRAWMMRFGGLFNKRRHDRELDDEIESHLQMHIEDNLRLGMTPEEARRQALIRLGGVESTKEACRDQRGLPWLEALGQDVRYSARMLRKNPGFTAVAVLTLALGIGANTAVFGLINELLLRPLPVKEPANLLGIVLVDQTGDFAGQNIPYPVFRDYHEQSKAVFSDLCAYATLFAPVEIAGEPRFALAQLAAANYFSTLGIQPVLGQFFATPDDSLSDPGAVVVLSYAAWQSWFNGDAGVLGKAITVRPAFATPLICTVIGVAPAGFQGLNQPSPQFWIPAVMEEHFKRATSVSFHLVGRLKSGVSPAQARVALDVLAARVATQYGGRVIPGYENEGIFRSGLRTELRPAALGSWGAFRSHATLRKARLLALGVAALILLIACTNIANLLLARADHRQKEIAIRLSLGAGRGKILRLVVLETLLLSLLGGIVGLLLAHFGNRLLIALKPGDVELLVPTALDLRVAGFSLLVALFSGLLVGGVPAWCAARQNPNIALKGRQTSRRSVHGWPLRSGLAVSQIALSLVLLVAAGLCLRSFLSLLTFHPGFDTRNLAVIPAEFRNVPEAASGGFNRELTRRLLTLPGVESVSWARYFPMLRGEGLGGMSAPVDRIEGYQPRPDEFLSVEFTEVGPDYFETVGIPVTTTPNRPLGGQAELVWANEAFVRRYWPGQNPLGRRVGPWQIDGVVKDARLKNLWDPPTPHLFRQRSEPQIASGVIMIRTPGDPSVVLDSVRAELLALDPELDLSRMMSMRGVIHQSLRSERFMAVLLGLLALCAVLLALLGIYGVVSGLVSQHVHEIGIRLALGASRTQIMNWVLRHGFLLMLSGLLLGLLGSSATTRLLASLLFEIHPTDPLTLAGVSTLLMLAAFVACWLPARRAARVDPMVALRAE